MPGDGLGEAGLKVDLVESGLKAVELAGQTDYALILTDMMMPRMGGIEAARMIRALPGRAQTPILAMTANAFDDDRRRCLDAGMNDHIGKPIEPEKVYETVLRFLRQTRA